MTTPAVNSPSYALLRYLPTTFYLPNNDQYNATLTSYSGTPVDTMYLANSIGNQNNANGVFYVGNQGGNVYGQPVVVTNANGLTFTATAHQSPISSDTVVWNIVITNAS